LTSSVAVCFSRTPAPHIFTYNSSLRPSPPHKSLHVFKPCNLYKQKESHLYSTNTFRYRIPQLQIRTRQAMYVYRTTEGHSCNRCFSGKAIRITQPERVQVSSLQSACAILSSVACPAQYFSQVSHKWFEFKKKKNLNT
jgi:hypothetical protein